MNERIQEIAKQCWDQRIDGQLHFDAEQFAVMIIGHATECVRDVLRDENSELTYAAASQVQKRIKEFFGVEW